MPTGADQVELAEGFIGYAILPDQLARLAETIPPGPARSSGMQRVGFNAALGNNMLDYLPNSPLHARRVVDDDSAWNAGTQGLRSRRFREWLEGQPASVGIP